MLVDGEGQTEHSEYTSEKSLKEKGSWAKHQGVWLGTTMNDISFCICCILVQIHLFYYIS